ncbi:MAG: hypothetical protein JO186_05130, partial [Actinobacteria bacterium]|nr:hypothetical protein [Actinomycetota bacterium]
MRARARTQHLVALRAYVAISFAFVGVRILSHPGRLLIGGSNTRDPEFFIWSFAWWPHAIAHWTNPFYTHVIYAPSGVNIAWTATAPGLALAAIPVTVLFGPAVAYNVVALLLPALAAWTAYLLCRHLTRSLWASLVGGFLFGFSSALLQEELWGNLDITGVFLMPLFALAVLRFVQHELDARGLVWRLGVLVAAQIWISTEHAFTTTLVLVLAWLLALWLVPGARTRLREAVMPIVVGYVLAAVIAAPFVAYIVLGLHAGSGFYPARVGVDLLNLVVPTDITGIGGSWFHGLSDRFTATGAYLGLPALVIVGLFAMRARAAGRFLVALFLVCVLIELGSRLFVAGHEVVTLPWRATDVLPLFKDVFPFRFAPFVALAVAVIVALWTAGSRSGTARILLPLLAVVSVVPALWESSFRAFALWHPPRPAFFAQRLYSPCLDGETVTIFPFGQYGDSLLYQGESGFRFRMASDWLQPGTAPGKKAWSSFDDDWVVGQLNGYAMPSVDTLLAFAALHHVGRYVVVRGTDYPTPSELRQMGPTKLVGGVYVTPACGSPPLT